MPRKRKPKVQDLRPGREGKRPEQLLFPSPGPMPNVFYLPDGRLDRHRMQYQPHEWESRQLVHKAVHTNDPYWRNIVANFMSVCLQEGLPLPDVGREYVSWILRRLIEKDQVPHMARGNAIKTYERDGLTIQLAHVLHHLPPGTVTARLGAAAKILNVSFGKARAMYYTELCQDWLETLLEDSKKSPSK